MNAAAVQLALSEAVTFKAAHDGEWIGQDGFIGKDVPRYLWRLAALRNWWDNLWK